MLAQACIKALTFHNLIMCALDQAYLFQTLIVFARWLYVASCVWLALRLLAYIAENGPDMATCKVSIVCAKPLNHRTSTGTTRSHPTLNNLGQNSIVENWTCYVASCC